MKKGLIILVLCVLAFAGCVRNTIGEKPDNVGYTSSYLERNLYVETSSFSQTNLGGEMSVVFRNKDDDNIKVQCRTMFLGPGGNVVDEPTAWSPLFIKANGAAVYKAQYAGQPGSVIDYYVEVDEVK